MLSLVISFMGIKLRWFRHRLTLDQPENQTEAPVLLRTTSVTEIRENCARGVYRQSVDAEALVFNDLPSVPLRNGKTKTKSSKYHLSEWNVISHQMLIATIENLLHVIMLIMDVYASAISYRYRN